MRKPGKERSTIQTKYTKKLAYASSGVNSIAYRLLVPAEIVEAMGLVKGDDLLVVYDEKKKSFTVRKKLSTDVEQDS